MAFLIGEANNFGLNRRAVARTDALDNPVSHGRAVQIFTKNFVRAGVGVGKVAANLIVGGRVRHEGKILHTFIAALNFHFAEVQSSGVDAGGRTGFEAHEFDAEIFQRSGKFDSGALPVGTAVENTFANDNPAA